MVGAQPAFALGRAWVGRGGVLDRSVRGGHGVAVGGALLANAVTHMAVSAVTASPVPSLLLASLLVG